MRKPNRAQRERKEISETLSHYLAILNRQTEQQRHAILKWKVGRNDATEKAIRLSREIAKLERSVDWLRGVLAKIDDFVSILAGSVRLRVPSFAARRHCSLQWSLPECHSEFHW